MPKKKAYAAMPSHACLPAWFFPISWMATGMLIIIAATWLFFWLAGCRSGEHLSTLVCQSPYSLPLLITFACAALVGFLIFLFGLSDLFKL